MDLAGGNYFFVNVLNLSSIVSKITGSRFSVFTLSIAKGRTQVGESHPVAVQLKNNLKKEDMKQCFKMPPVIELFSAF